MLNELWSKIVAFFSSIVMAIAALFGLGGGTPEPTPDPEPEVPVIVEHGDWLLENIPAYGAGLYSTALYNTGTGMDYEYAAAEDEDEPAAPADEEDEGSADPEPEATHKDSYMQLVSSTTAADFDAYCGTLETNGYTLSFGNQIENNLYRAYEKEGQSVYLIHDGNRHVTRVIDDCVNTVSLSQFGYDAETASAGEHAQPGVYQFSYPYYDPVTHTIPDLYASNGMLYVILLPDNRLVVIDAGAAKQSTEQNVAEFVRFVRKLTGKTKHDVIDIALWYGTHSHADHINFFSKTIRKFHGQFNVQRAMFNYQSMDTVAYTTKVNRLKLRFSMWYPDMQYIKPRCGYSFNLGEAKFEVLYTHEEMVNPLDATYAITNANDASTVVKMTLGGKSFLFLGDSNLIVEDTLLKNFTAATLHTDVLQAAHHMYNDLTRLYPVVAPTYVLCPQSKVRTVQTGLTAYQTLLKIVPEENLYFAGDNIIYGFLPQSNGTILITETPDACGAYDNSSL
ncbi:MAG: hypothetical protein IJL52_07035 [Clostridia bacterium]|nr:hypothetical protein [Clostridia bacterium]